MKYLLFCLVLILLFAKVDLNGQNIPVYAQFSEFEPILQYNNDTTYVVNFWATWCIPCVKELPEFQAINQQFKGEKFKMILASLDFEKQIESKVKPFIEEKNIEAQVVVLADSKQHLWIDKVDQEWGGSIPMTIIYNKDFRYFKEGSMTYEELEKIITKNIIK